MRKLLEVLASLQAAAARLTPTGPVSDANSEVELDSAVAASLRKKLPVDAYSVAFDPLMYHPRKVKPPDWMMAAVADDLTDIYRNLMEGLILYHADQIQDALWHWHFTYDSHWGRHLSHAQYAIWQYLSEGNSSE